jgi:L-alanine-DL-glutamate epimerase-like enolase superfamily enzyme
VKEAAMNPPKDTPPSRRLFLLKSGAAAGTLAVAGSAHARPEPRPPEGEAREDLGRRLREAVQAPVLRQDLFPQPVTLASVELLRSGRFFLVRARSADGATGLAEANGAVLQSAHPILVQRVAPFFAGKDARGIEALVDGVYLDQSNYKWQGLPFWSCVASVELAVLDLLGQVAGRSLGDLLGGVRRHEIEVYRASGHRGNPPEEELEYLQKVVEEDGAKAIKFRLGGRMRYDEATTRRDRALIRMTRKAFGDAVTLYADANGSYDVPKGVEIGRVMQDHGFRFYEEPVPFDHYEETRQIADALAIPIAGGEEEASLRQFRWMIETGVLQVVQPDLFYFGGMVRSLRVARMAEAAGLECTLHMSGGGLGFLYAAHFASFAPAHGPHQEYKGADDLPVSSPTAALRAAKGVVRVPSGPGLGVVFDPAFVRGARPIEA